MLYNKWVTGVITGPTLWNLGVWWFVTIFQGLGGFWNCPPRESCHLNQLVYRMGYTLENTKGQDAIITLHDQDVGHFVGRTEPLLLAGWEHSKVVINDAPSHLDIGLRVSKSLMDWGFNTRTLVAVNEDSRTRWMAIPRERYLAKMEGRESGECWVFSMVVDPKI